MNSLVEKGFINYYGMQRFGHCHHEDGFLLTPVIGHLMLRDEPVSSLSLLFHCVLFLVHLFLFSLQLLGSCC